MDDAKLITEALAALKDYQQADEDGVMVLVSRQAIDVVAAEMERIRAQAEDATEYVLAQLLREERDRLEAALAEVERLKEIVQDEARWQPIAASYRDERDEANERAERLAAGLQKIANVKGIYGAQAFEFQKIAIDALSPVPGDLGAEK